MIPIPVVLISAVAAVLGLFVAMTWLFSRDPGMWKRESRRVLCPRDRSGADIEVATEPEDPFEFLVTSKPDCRTRVSRCSFFGDGEVRCSGRCLDTVCD
ncbi:MAG: hypothetical protein HY319_21595 [Armatimonadetes bacterium]|nr:hypothetical protein [Armatimonadota bacterium]